MLVRPGQGAESAAVSHPTNRDERPALLRYRSVNYRHASSRFHRIRTHFPGKRRWFQFEHPERGAFGERLRTQVLVVGPRNARRVIFISTGVHGAEYLPGNALATLFVWLLAGQSLPIDTAFVFVDAVNPWGCSWGTREDEGGRDPNRVFPVSGDLPPARCYERVHGLVHARDFKGDHWNEVERTRAAFINLHGERAFFDALSSGGQSSHPNGLYYRGDGTACYVADTFTRIVEQVSSGLEVLLHFDLHTSLGAFGEATVITQHHDDSEEMRVLRRHVQDAVPVQTLNKPSIAYPVRGTTMCAVSEASRAEITVSATLELGTYSRARGLSANIASNLLARERWSPRSVVGRRVREHVQEHFAPSNPEWWAKALTHGRRIFETLLIPPVHT